MSRITENGFQSDCLRCMLKSSNGMKCSEINYVHNWNFVNREAMHVSAKLWVRLDFKHPFQHNESMISDTDTKLFAQIANRNKYRYGP
jgi:hypothetical protein